MQKMQSKNGPPKIRMQKKCKTNANPFFPNSHQVWGLLLTRWVFVLASIFGKCTVGVPVYFPLGVPVVSRSCPVRVPVVSWAPAVLRWCPGRVSVVVCWCPSRVPVVSQSCPSGVPVLFQWCPLVSRWFLSCGVPVVSLSSCNGVPAVPQWCPGGVPVVSSGVPVVFERWCPGRVSVVVEGCPSRAPVVSRWCSSGVHWRPGRVPVLSGWCPGSVPAVIHPVVVLVLCRGCPGCVPVVGVLVSTTISENL